MNRIPMWMTSPLVALALGCAGMKGGGASQAVASADYKQTGAVYCAFGNATFDATSVRGSRINVSRRADGSWGGTLSDYSIDVNVTARSIIGANLRLNVEQAADGYIITGLLDENQLRFEVKADHFLARTRTHGFSLPASGPGRYGPLGEVRFEGVAASASPPEPQVALALVAAFLDEGNNNRGRMGGGGK